MEEATNLVVNDDGGQALTLAGAGFDAAPRMFCTLRAETPEEQTILFNAISNPAVRISEMIGKTIVVKDVVVQEILLINDNGEVSPCKRVVIIDPKGVSYVAVSQGIFNALNMAYGIYGAPHTPRGAIWEKGVKFEVQQITKGANRVFTLKAIG